TFAPAGSVAPIRTRTGACAVTVVVNVCALWRALTSTLPDAPRRMFEPAIGAGDGGWGTTSSRPRPRSGRTPSCWWTTGQAVPYAPHAWSTDARSVNFL